jgi:PAS domain S-box-containing protein
MSAHPAIGTVPPPAPATPEATTAQSSVLWVDAEGRILDCCEHAPQLFGYRNETLRGQTISLLLPELAHGELLQGDSINPRLAYRCRCATPFLSLDRDGVSHACTLFVNLVHLSTGPALALIVRRMYG